MDIECENIWLKKINQNFSDNCLNTSFYISSFQLNKENKTVNLFNTLKEIFFYDKGRYPDIEHKNGISPSLFFYQILLGSVNDIYLYQIEHFFLSALNPKKKELYDKHLNENLKTLNRIDLFNVFLTENNDLLKQLMNLKTSESVFNKKFSTMFLFAVSLKMVNMYDEVFLFKNMLSKDESLDFLETLDENNRYFFIKNAYFENSGFNKFNVAKYEDCVDVLSELKNKDIFLNNKSVNLYINLYEIFMDVIHEYITEGKNDLNLILFEKSLVELKIFKEWSDLSSDNNKNILKKINDIEKSLYFTYFKSGVDVDNQSKERYFKSDKLVLENVTFKEIPLKNKGSTIFGNLKILSKLDLSHETSIVIKKVDLNNIFGYSSNFFNKRNFREKLLDILEERVSVANKELALFKDEYESNIIPELNFAIHDEKLYINAISFEKDSFLNNNVNLFHRLSENLMIELVNFKDFYSYSYTNGLAIVENYIMHKELNKSKSKKTLKNRKF